jgi:hypothetical protein
VAFTLPHFDGANLHPFMPHGFTKTTGLDGVERGVMAAAAIIFFAFYGFDAISTAAEEAKNPERDLAIGIVGSMIACTIIYVLVAAAAVGALPYTRFADSPEPLALILREMGQGRVAQMHRRDRGDHRFADGAAGLPLRPEPHLPRDGARRLPADQARQNLEARHAGTHHRADRGAGQRSSRACCRSTRSRHSPMPVR